jgi:hypothetical protein
VRLQSDPLPQTEPGTERLDKFPAAETPGKGAAPGKTIDIFLTNGRILDERAERQLLFFRIRRQGRLACLIGPGGSWAFAIRAKRK